MTVSPGTAAGLRVLCGGALREIVDELGQRFGRLHDIKVAAEFTTSAAIRDRARADPSFDVVITTSPVIEALTASQTIVAESAAVVARSGIGVAVRAAARKPDISSTEAFVATLRGAHSIARADPAVGTPSGIYIQALFDRLGLTADLAPKTRFVPSIGGRPVVVCEAIAKGEAELGIQQISEIMAVAGVDLVGPLPAEIQHITDFWAAATAASQHTAIARQFVDFLGAPSSRAVMVAHGMEPL